MPVRDEPYLDVNGVRVSKARARDALIILVVVPLIALLSIGWVYWVISTAAETQADKNAFMAKCIEFNHPDRCLELDRWGRRDLFDRKDFR